MSGSRTEGTELAMKVFTAAEADQYVSDMFSVNDGLKDDSGMIVIRTGLYKWSDGTFRDTKQPPSFEYTPAVVSSIVFRGSGRVGQ